MHVESFTVAESGCPLVTVVVPTFNSVAMLEELLISIRNQTYESVEVIVVDNLSSDGTPELARAFRCRLVSKASNRLVARHEGVLRAKGRYVLFADSDQTLDPSCIRELVRRSRATGASAITLLELCRRTDRWGALLRLEDRIEFETDAGLPRWFPRAIIEEFPASEYASAAHVHGEDRIIRQWLLDRGYSIVREPGAVLRHLDPPLEGYFRKQVRNASVGTSGKLLGEYLSVTGRSLSGRLDLFTVARVSRSPAAFLEYATLSALKVGAQLGGMLWSKLISERRSRPHA
jgi:glycosyltransferase involved in cell wall biosynthesis